MSDKRLRRRRGRALAGLGLALISSNQVLAVNRTWQSPAGGTWTVGANWNPSATPASGDNLFLSVDVTYPISLTASAVGSSITVSNGTVSLNSGTLISGGTATVDDTAATGLSDGAQLTIDGARWTNTSNEVIVGSAGFGQLSVINAGSLSHGGLRVGSSTLSGGQVAVSGTSSVIGRINTTNAATIGVNGAGTFNLLGGARGNNSGVTLGQQVSGTGYALVSGPGTIWQIGMNGSSLTVGQSGAGTLQVTNGGIVRISNTDASGNTQQPVTANQLIVGGLAGATGVVMLDGPGTQLYVGNTSEVGDNGTGFGTVTNGASWVLGDKFSIGVHTTAFGTIGIHGAGSNIQVTNDLLVGRDEGLGTLLIDTGGQIIGTGVNKIGWNANAKGYANVDGLGSGWSAQDFWIGDAGHGTFLLSNGATLTSNNTMVGATGGGVGVGTIGGAGSGFPATMTIGGTLALAGSTTADGGQGTFTVNTDGFVSVPNIKIWNSGTLVLNGGTINAGTVILTTANSKFNFTSGTFRYTGSRALDSGALSNVLGAGTPTIGAGQHLAVQSTATLSSALRLNGGSFSVGSISNLGSLTFDAGTFNLTSASLTIGTGGLFGNAPNLGSGKAINITNQASILSTGSLTLAGGFFGAGSILNSGSIIINGGTLSTFTGSFSHSGLMSLTNATINGTVALSVVSVSTVNVPSGVASFNGAVTGVATSTGAGRTRFNGSYSTGAAAATASFAGDVSFGPTDTLKIKVGGHTPGAQHDRLAIVGDLDAAGSLAVTLTSGFSPMPGETFDVITSGTHSAGDFTVINDPAKPALKFSTLFDSSKMQLVTGATFTGDANLDAVVDIRDLTALALHWGQSGNWLAGDFNLDGTVNDVDLGMLAANWQAGTAAPGPSLSPALLASLGLPTNVPEPAAGSLIACCVGLLAARRRRRITDQRPAIAR